VKRCEEKLVRNEAESLKFALFCFATASGTYQYIYRAIRELIAGFGDSVGEQLRDVPRDDNKWHMKFEM
jgi:hypothetical protein